MNNNDNFVKGFSRTLGMPNNITQLIIEDNSIIAYKTSFVPIAGSVMSAILLGQIMYWAKRSNNKFYKFKEPCDHPDYRPGDSWVEELGFTKYEFDGAIKNIAARVVKNKPADPDKFVYYYIDFNRVTWYFVNWKALNKAIINNSNIHEDVAESTDNSLNGKNPFSYVEKTDLAKSEKPIYLNGKNQDTIYIDTEINNREYNHRQSAAENDTLPEQENDDDDLLILLEKFGLSEKQIKRIKESLDVEEILARHDSIIAQLEKQKIKNVAAYAYEVFSNNSNQSIMEEYLESENKRKKMLERERQQQRMKKEKFEKESEEKNINGLESMKESIYNADEETLKRFEEKYSNNFVYQTAIAKKENWKESLAIQALFSDFLKGERK